MLRQTEKTDRTGGDKEEPRHSVAVYTLAGPPKSQLLGRLELKGSYSPGVQDLPAQDSEVQSRKQANTEGGRGRGEGQGATEAGCMYILQENKAD